LYLGVRLLKDRQIVKAHEGASFSLEGRVVESALGPVHQLGDVDI